MNATPPTPEPSAEALAAAKDILDGAGLEGYEQSEVLAAASVIDAEFAALHARLERAEEDSKRLDWLIANQAFVTKGQRAKTRRGGLSKDNMEEVFQVDWVANDKSLNWQGPDAGKLEPRAAIDAAMSAPSAKPGEGGESMSTPIDDGGPAFPRAAFTPGEGHDHFSSGGFTSYQQEGMSLRQWYKGQALSAILKDKRYAECGNEAACAYEIARYAGLIADAMLAEDAAKPGEFRFSGDR